MDSLRIPAAFLLALLASCSAEASYGDPTEPLTIEDLQPIPAEVTKTNARMIVRRALQAHKRSASLPDEQFGYVFRDEGFVQVCHVTPTDRTQERISRTFVPFASITSASAEPYFDLQFIRERVRVAVTGRFRKWEGPVHPVRALPSLGSEPRLVDLDSLSLVLDDAVLAKGLRDALLLLSGR